MKIVTEKSFNESYTDSIIDKNILFSESIYKEYFGLLCVEEFLQSVTFENCVFEDLVVIHSCIFRKGLFFNNCTFNNSTKYLELSVLHIVGALSFNNCNFEGRVKFIDSTIMGNSNFHKCIFNKGINLFSPNMDSIGNVNFEGGLNVLG